MKLQDRQELQKKYRRLSDKFERALLKIGLKESGEELVSLVELKNKSSTLNKDSNGAFLRKSVADQLMLAADYFFEQGLSLKLESSLRSLEEQQVRFITRYNLVKSAYPQKSREELLKMANTYTAGIPILAAHTAGAAVDVTLLDQKGTALDFGVPYRHGDIESITDYPHVSKKVKENRKLLKEGMKNFGFVNYPFEYWHYSIGDVCAAHLTGQKYAKFGPVNYNPESNKTSFPKITNAFYTFFKT